MKLLFAIAIALCIHLNAHAQNKTIKIHFLYGSKPGKNFKHTERNWFGGTKGGHVSMEVDEYVIGFEPKGKFHVFANDRERHSYYAFQSLKDWAKDTASKKYLSILLPVTDEQYERLQLIHQNYREAAPYDYAFFGFRCASSTYEILAQLELAPMLGRHSTVIRYFYPKRLRNFMIQEAKKNDYTIVYHEGRSSRKWEKDTKKDRTIIQELKKPVKRKLKRKYRAAYPYGLPSST